MNILFLGVGLWEHRDEFEFIINHKHTYLICGDQAFNRAMIRKLNRLKIRYSLIDVERLYHVMILTGWKWDHIYVHPSPNQYVTNWINDEIHVKVFIQHVMSKMIPVYSHSKLHLWEYTPITTTFNLN